jgi:glycine/D-amino acid oxidase-like deaminating enzyme
VKEATQMNIAIVGAGLAGLATAAAFNRAGHDVGVFEQADCLRADGLAINLWSNATSLLPSLGVPASRFPGEPFSRMVWRAAGREVTTMELPAQGLPHVNVERGKPASRPRPSGRNGRAANGTVRRAGAAPDHPADDRRARLGPG